MAKKKKKQKLPKGISILIIILAVICSIYEKDIDKTFGLPVTETKVTTKEENHNLNITYLDVGQADAILIQNDAGNNEDGPLLVQYFKEQNITKFDYLIATHPHEDHIGGMDDIVKNFDIDKIYMPDVTTTTKTFLDLLNAIEEKNMTFDVPKINQSFTLGHTLFQVIYTGNDKKNLNNASTVLKASFKNTSYLFTGDATSKVEKKILKKENSLTI